MYCSLKRRRMAILVLCSVLTLGVVTHAQSSVNGEQPAGFVTILDSSKEQDGLKGSVRRVKIQSAKLELKSGQPVEGPLRLLEVTTYDLRGKRIDNVSYPAPNALVGKEEYKYDDKGNIIQMTLRGDDGSILSRESYDYEFDRFTNWTKMVTSLVIFEAGELKREPVEVTYRTFTYYFDDSIAKIVNAAARPVTPRGPEPTRSPAVNSVLNNESLVKVQDNLPRGEAAASSSVVVADSPPDLTKPPKAEKTAPSKRLEDHPDTNASSVQTEAPTGTSAPAEAVAAETTTSRGVAGEENPAANATARPNALDYYKTGRKLFDSGDLKGAIKAYQQSIQLESGSAQVYLSLGQAYLNLKKDQDAVKAFAQSARLNPKNAETYYGLGLGHFKMNHNRDAADAFKRATLLRPDMAKAHYGLALAYQELGRNDALIEEYKILENLDRRLAIQLSRTFPTFNFPCARPDCK